jgi:hypothetical protein
MADTYTHAGVAWWRDWRSCSQLLSTQTRSVDLHRMTALAQATERCWSFLRAAPLTSYFISRAEPTSIQHNCVDAPRVVDVEQRVCFENQQVRCLSRVDGTDRAAETERSCGFAGGALQGL